MAGGVSSALAQEPAHFVTYIAPWLEREYGLTSWRTAELYLEGVATQHDGGPD
jgi:hypothetical protein